MKEKFFTSYFVFLKKLILSLYLTFFILVSIPVDGLSNNLETCLSGNYPSLCKYNLLTQEEKIQAKNAEREVNLKTCLSGNYPSLCKHDLLTQEEKIRVENAENLDNLKTCLSGKYPSLCNHKLLSPIQLKAIRRLEEIER